MQAEPIGITFQETMSGPFALGESDPVAGEQAGKAAGTSLALHATITIADLDRFIADRSHTGEISGRIDFDPFGRKLPAPTGVFRLFSPTEEPHLRHMVYEVAFEHDGRPFYLAGHKRVRNDKHGADLWDDTTTLFTRLHEGTDATGPVVGAGVLRLGVPALVRMTASMKAVNATRKADRMRAIATFGGFFMGGLWDAYGPQRRA